MDFIHFYETLRRDFSRGSTLGSLRLLSRTAACKVSKLTRMHPNGTFGYSSRNDVQPRAAQPIVSFDGLEGLALQT
jgi:hypothetical protein